MRKLSGRGVSGGRGWSDSKAEEWAARVERAGGRASSDGNMEVRMRIV